MFVGIEMYLEKNRNDIEAWEDYFGLVREERDRERCKFLRENMERIVRESEDIEVIEKAYDILKRSYLLFASEYFEDYCIYLEWERNVEKKFYLPRKRTLSILVQDLQDLAERKIDFLGVSLPPRTGKLVADSTLVLTTKGWKKHGELRVGDYVYSPEGKAVKVIAVHEKYHTTHTVEFTNGEKIKCHYNHEWCVKPRKSKERVIETREMIGNLDNKKERGRGHRYSYQIPLKQPIQGEDKELPVSPYTLGAWLGDGTNKAPLISNSEEDSAVIDRIISDGYDITNVYVHKGTGVISTEFGRLRQDLRKVNMCHSKKVLAKHIPDVYLTASLEQRLELLAGLIDSDGTLVKRDKRYKYSTVSERLKDDIVTLISTFGWRASVTKYEPPNREEKIAKGHTIIGKQKVYVIGFNPDFEIPCVLERKKLKEFSKRRMVSIKDIYESEPESGNCITVEGGKYLIGNALMTTHNSTLCIFFITWLMGRNPSKANVMSGHSDKLTNGFYEEVLNIIKSDEYLWKDVFSVQLANNSAKNETIDLESKKRFPTFTARSIGGTLTGAVEIGEGGCLYVDDLIEDLEESLNPERLQNKYDAYLNQLKDRKKDGAFELMVGTRWNVLDPLGRIEEQYSGNPRYRFRVIPALNEEGESNFAYDYGVGFSTEYYKDMKTSIDDATWSAKYMGNPYIREGLLFPADELNYYNGVLPDGECYQVAVCDVAWGGGDSLSMPFAWVFGSDIYIGDVIFNDGDKEITRPIVIDRIKKHRPHEVEFEANNGGHEYSDKVDEELRKEGVRINITNKKAPNKQSKFGKILQYSPEIKKFYFLDSLHRSKEYEKFMKEVTTFSQTGKNPHDDSVDSLAILAKKIFSGGGRAEIIKRPF